MEKYYAVSILIMIVTLIMIYKSIFHTPDFTSIPAFEKVIFILAGALTLLMCLAIFMSKFNANITTSRLNKCMVYMLSFFFIDLVILLIMKLQSNMNYKKERAIRRLKDQK